MLLICALLAVTLGNQTSNLEIKSIWPGGMSAEICLEHDFTIDCGWEMELHFTQPLTNFNIWSAEEMSRRADNSGTRVVMKHLTWSKAQPSGTCHPFNAYFSLEPKVTASYTKICSRGIWTDVSSGSDNSGQTTKLPPRLPLTSQRPKHNKLEFDYYVSLQKSMMFYFAQRSGPIRDNIVPWRTADSAMTDGNDIPRDLVGGWYDAGDHVKFNFPMAGSTTTLVWGFIKWQDAYTAAKRLDEMYKLIKHPLDYFLKCWDNKNKKLYGQVGDGDIDHAVWQRPEDMRMKRPTFYLSKDKGGSDLAGETAAALAAGALAFKKKDSGYAQQLLTAAEQVYDFADTYRREYHLSIPNADQFYKSFSGYEDELCWGAAWLLKATGKETYRSKAKMAMSKMDQYPDEYSWDSKAIGCYMLMYEMSKGSEQDGYRSKIVSFMNKWVNFQSPVKKTQCGLAWLREWGALRYSANTALIGLMAAENGINPSTYRTWAEKQIKYMLGANRKKFSFQVGFGDTFPLRPHHQSATCPRAPAPCDWSTFNNPSPNAHELTGALVGGPGENDEYEDDRTDYVKNEVTTDYNAGFQSALAGLVHLHLTNELPNAKPDCPK